MASLQEVHGILQNLCSGEAYKGIGIEVLASHANDKREEVEKKLRLLQDLGYINFSRSKELVCLSENGVITQPFSTFQSATARYVLLLCATLPASAPHVPFAQNRSFHKQKIARFSVRTGAAVHYSA